MLRSIFTPGVLVGHDEHRHAAVGAGLGAGHGHDDEELRVAGVGREELPAVDDPLVTVPLGVGLEHARVGTALRLGHREAGHDLTLEQRLEVVLLLLVGAVVRQDLGVACVRGLGAEDPPAPAPGCAQLLVEQRQLDLAVALAAQLRAQVRRPQLLVAHGLLHRVDDGPLLRGLLLVDVVRPDELERRDVVLDELLDPVQLLLELGVGTEVPCHDGILRIIGGPRLVALPAPGSEPHGERDLTMRRRSSTGPRRSRVGEQASSSQGAQNCD